MLKRARKRMQRVQKQCYIPYVARARLTAFFLKITCADHALAQHIAIASDLSNLMLLVKY